MDAVLDELYDCLPSYDEGNDDGERIREVINGFLRSLPDEKRRIFIRRYWYLSPIAEIAESFNVSEGKVKMILMRARKELKKTLEKEGVYL